MAESPQEEDATLYLQDRQTSVAYPLDAVGAGMVCAGSGSRWDAVETPSEAHGRPSRVVA